MSWWQTALTILKETLGKPRFLFGISLGCVIVLVLPEQLLQKSGMWAIVGPVRGWVVLVAIFAFCLGVVQVVPDVRESLHQRRQRTAVLRCLDSLSKEEKIFLAYCLARNRQTLVLPQGSLEGNIASGLCQKDLMLKAHGSQNILAWPHTIPEFVWRELQRRRSFLLPPGWEKNAAMQKCFANADVMASGAHGVVVR